MDLLLQLLTGLIQALVLLALAPLLSGFSRVLRAKFHSRRGPPLLQDYQDLRKLLNRREIIPVDAGAVFRATPSIFLVAMLTIASAIPAVTLASPIPAVGDIIAIIYLFALGRFFFSLSGIDSGSVFGGIGASRETSLAIVNEPIMMLSLFVVALSVGSTNLGTIAQAITTGHTTSFAAVILAMLAFAFALFVEMGKLPFDLAEAEQELQEGPLTEYSGPSLALMKWGLFLRQTVAAALFLGIFVPFGSPSSFSLPALAIGIGALTIKLIAVLILLSFIENAMARVRFLYSTQFTFVAAGAAMLAFAFFIAGL